MADPKEPKFSPTPISVSDSKITPITQQEIKSVDGLQWTEMSISQLHRELTTMRSRLTALLSMDKVAAANQIQIGISTIESIINNKYKNTDTFI